MDEAAVALGRARGGCGLKEEAGAALLGQAGAGFAAGFGFSIERLRDRGRAAHFAERENLDLVIASFSLNGKHVADADFAGGTQRLMARLDTAQLAGFGGEGAGFEEARGPQPFVEAHEHSVNPASEKTVS